jgi:hypothetical protein
VISGQHRKSRQEKGLVKIFRAVPVCVSSFPSSMEGKRSVYWIQIISLGIK